MEGLEAITARARGVLERNAAELGEHRFTYPSRKTYLGLFGWDSGFHAAALAGLDADAARREVLALLSFQDPDGRLSHEVRLGAPNLSRRIALWALRKAFDEKGVSRFVDPPVIVSSAWLVYEMEKNDEFLVRVYPPLVQLMAWLHMRRTVESPILVSILHPYESGTDVSPQFDDAVGTDFASRLAGPAHGLKYLRLIDFYHRHGWDLAELGTRAPFIYQDPLFNAVMIRGWLALSRMAIALRRWDESKTFQRSALLQAAQMDKDLWDPEAGLYRGRYWTEAGWKPSARLTLSGAAPIFSGLIARDKVRIMVDRHLSAEDGFWTPMPFSYNSVRETPARERPGGAMLWRGLCAWMNFNWMLGVGLLEYGYLNLVKEMTARCAAAVEDQGFREYYHAQTGRGMGAEDYSWSALVWDLMRRVAQIEEQLG